MTAVFVVAEVRLYRDGIAQSLAREGGIEVVGTAASTAEALDRIGKVEPDTVLVDVSAAGGVNEVRDLVDAVPGTKVLALSISDGEQDVVDFAEAGVAGYVTRDAGLAELVAVLKGVEHGDVHCSPKMAGVLLRRVTTLAARPGGAPPEPKLTSREREVVELIDDGLSNKEIARRLYIEVATVKNHVHNILEKLQVHRRADAAAILRGHARGRPLHLGGR